MIPRLDEVVDTMKLHEIFVQYENDKIKTFVRNNTGEQAQQITIKLKQYRCLQMPTDARFGYIIKTKKINFLMSDWCHSGSEVELEDVTNAKKEHQGD